MCWHVRINRAALGSLGKQRLIRTRREAMIQAKLGNMGQKAIAMKDHVPITTGRLIRTVREAALHAVHHTTTTKTMKVHMICLHRGLRTRRAQACGIKHAATYGIAMKINVAINVGCLIRTGREAT